MNYSFHLWQILSAIGVLVALDWLSTWFADQYEISWTRTGPRATRRWYGMRARVFLRDDAKRWEQRNQGRYVDNEEFPVFSVLEWLNESTPVPWLLVQRADDGEEGPGDEDLEPFWAPVTSFAPCTVRRLRPWIFRFGWLRLPVLFSYRPVRQPVGYPEDGA
jgi:hypothetical protein